MPTSARVLRIGRYSGSIRAEPKSERSPPTGIQHTTLAFIVARQSVMIARCRGPRESPEGFSGEGDEDAGP